MQLDELRSFHQWPSEPPEVPINGHGWLAPSTARVLSRYLNEETNLVIELGSWLGKSTRFILERASNSTVISVDLWDPKANTPTGTDRVTQKFSRLSDVLPTLKETFVKNCWAWRDRLIPVQMNSLQAVPYMAEMRPDVVYLDTSHSYSQTLNEIRIILHTFPETVLVGDDWNWEAPELGEDYANLPVRRAVFTAFSDGPPRTLEIDDNGWVLRYSKPLPSTH